ncbi:MAG: hypothetical protein ACJ75B_09735 [Flavisolibacter sp.]
MITVKKCIVVQIALLFPAVVYAFTGRHFAYSLLYIPVSIFLFVVVTYKPLSLVLQYEEKSPEINRNKRSLGWYVRKHFYHSKILALNRHEIDSLEDVEMARYIISLKAAFKADFFQMPQSLLTVTLRSALQYKGLY